MNEIIALSSEQVAGIYRRYMLFDFPDDELKPLDRIEQSLQNGSYECCALANGEDILGYCFFVKLGKDYLLDYFAVVPQKRDRGLGSEFLALIAKRYAGCASLIAEVESPEFAADAEDRTLRERRLMFYLRNGFVDSGVDVYVFGVHYRLIELGSVSRHSQEEIRAIYRAHYKAMLPEKMYWRNIII